MVHALELAVLVEEIVGQEHFGLHHIHRPLRIFRYRCRKVLQRPSSIIILLRLNLRVVRQLRADEEDNVEQYDKTTVPGGLGVHFVEETGNVHEETELARMQEEVSEPVCDGELVRYGNLWSSKNIQGPHGLVVGLPLGLAPPRVRIMKSERRRG